MSKAFICLSHNNATPEQGLREQSGFESSQKFGRSNTRKEKLEDDEKKLQQELHADEKINAINWSIAEENVRLRVAEELLKET